MEVEGSSGSGMYRPRLDDVNRSCDGIAEAAELPSVDGCHPIDEMDDSQLVGVPAMGAVGSGDGSWGAPTAVVKAMVKDEDGGGGKRKRGRPPKGQPKPPPVKKMKEEEEDVCFICFDGGSLVLCDRRGCPKAYHPACIKRDEAFFRSRAKWNCGWHICSICQKAAHYMCYTCTYSLCKACTKFADYLCVRENKGFCTTCMRTILLIENNDNGNKEMAQVDFDDKSSWEYLFKVYWIYLKGKLCLTLDELSQAKNPWKAAGLVACNSQSSDIHYGGNDSKVSISDSFCGHLWTNDSKKRTEEHAEQPKLPSIEDSQSTGKSSTDEGTTSTESTEWASKELLELVAHMTNGDTSVLSQFDVQGLLLEYIKRYNLRDPRRKSQIICDSRLKILFGRPCVGHFEMLKLLEFHFPIKEDSKKEVVQGNIVDAVLSQAEGGGNNENLLMMGKDKKRKSRRKGEERGPQTNLNEFAAIDVHNINLVYLRRNLMESLIACNGKFHEKVVGSVVRIRISSSDQKQDMYRLVQVVGTCKVAIPYKIGEKTADVVLEILNLDKKETVSIDTISNQEFSEDECKRLRQSIKCGLVKLLTVGQVQDKAMALQEVRLNDWLETEVLRLNHLRDRASEKGRKKELRECVEKLELLKTPEERQRRLREIPEVHADPNMDPKCESDEDAGEVSNEKQDGCAKPRYSGFSRNGRVPISPRNGGSTNDFGSRAVKRLATYEQSRSKGAPIRVVERAKESSWHEGKDALGSNCLDKPVNRVDSSGSVVGGWNNQAVLRSGTFSGHASEPSIASLSTGSAPSANDSETDKLWHYRDPSGKIQGPFCMVQLRKWSTTGYFPPDMRIWSIDDEEVDSVLLTDVLNGKFHKVLPSRYNVSLPSQQANLASDCRDYCDDKRIGGVNTDGAAVNHSLGRWNCNGVAHSNGNNEFVRGGGCGSHSSNLTPPVVNNKDVLTGRCNNAYSDLPQVHSSVPSSKCVERQNETCPRQGRGDNQGEMRNCSPSPESWKYHGNGIYQTTGGHINANRSDCLGYSGHSSGETRMDLLVNFSLNNCKSNHGFASGVKSADSSDLKLEIDIPNLPSPTPRTRNGDLEGQTTKEKRSLPSDVPVRDLGIYNLPSPTPKPNDVDEKADLSVQHQPSPPAELMDGGQKVNSTIRNLPGLSPNRWDGDEKVQTTVSKPSVSSNVPVQDSGPSRSSPSRLAVGGGIQHPEIADEWGRSSTTSTKPSAEEWDSGLASVSSIKLPEVVSDLAATPTSGCDQLSPPSPLRPANNASSWKETITEPIEFSTLDEESVSDLLAEVDAMESQCGPASPTSVMYSGDELFQDTRNDCFTSFDGLSPQPDSGKSDALSSTGDIRLRHQQLSVTEEPLGASQADVKRCDGLASTSTEVGVERRDTDVSVNQTETGSSSLPAPSILNRETVNKDSANGAGPTSLNTDWGATQGKTSLGLEVTRGMANVGWGTSPGMARANANLNGSSLAGVLGRESQPKIGGERFIGARDWACQSGDLGFGRVRQTWSRQSSFGGGGGGGSGGGSCYSRPPPKGQRVCKFYESGHCKKGAFCEYLHP